MKKFILATAIFLFGVQSLLACTYGPPYMTVCEAYSKADLIVTGTVALLEGTSDSSQKVKILVDKTYKGIKKKEIIFTQNYSNCFWDFSKDDGKNILIYLIYDKKEKNYNFLVGMGGNVEQNNEDLYWLNNLPKSLKRTRISGTIWQYENVEGRFFSLSLVRDMKLNILGEGKKYEVLTDKNGVYELWDVPVGKYKIFPQIPDGFELRSVLSKGIIDFKQISENQVDTKDFMIEIKPTGCGGADYTLNKAKK